LVGPVTQAMSCCPLTCRSSALEFIKGGEACRWPLKTFDSYLELSVSKRTFQPNNRRRAKTHGFRLRMRSRAGRAVLAARRRKGRARVSV